MRKLFISLLFAACLRPPRTWAQPTSANSRGWGTADNVLAAIDHYGKHVQHNDASADDYKHLSTALRFAGRFQDCAAVMHKGLTQVPAFATGANYFMLANVLRAAGRAHDAVGAYQMAIVVEPLAANYYMQLGMTLQYHEIESGDMLLHALYNTAARISVPGDEVHMQSSLLHVSALLAKAQHLHLPHASSPRGAAGAGYRAHDNHQQLAEGLNRYRRLLGLSHAAWLRWCHALALPLPASLLRTYNRPFEQQIQRLHFAVDTSPHTDSARMHADMDAAFTALQAPRVCSSARAVVFRLESNIFGLGAQIHLLSLVASYAFATRRTLLAAEEDNWWYASDDCPSRSFHCYFQELSHCTLHGTNGIFPIARDIALLPQLGQHDEDRDRVVVASIEAEAWLKASGFRHAVPREFATMGLLWWRTQLIQRIFQPREFVKAHARAVAQEAAWPEAWEAAPGQARHVVGVHVRHGDKVLEEAPRVPLSSYVTAIRAAVNDIITSTKRRDSERLSKRDGMLQGSGKGDGEEDTGVGDGDSGGGGAGRNGGTALAPRIYVFVATDSAQILSEMAQIAPDLNASFTLTNPPRSPSLCPLPL